MILLLLLSELCSMFKVFNVMLKQKGANKFLWLDNIQSRLMMNVYKWKNVQKSMNGLITFNTVRSFLSWMKKTYNSRSQLAALKHDLAMDRVKLCFVYRKCLWYLRAFFVQVKSLFFCRYTLLVLFDSITL